jgi:hypothetical protein
MVRTGHGCYQLQCQLSAFGELSFSDGDYWFEQICEDRVIQMELGGNSTSESRPYSDSGRFLGKEQVRVILFVKGYSLQYLRRRYGNRHFYFSTMI